MRTARQGRPRMVGAGMGGFWEYFGINMALNYVENYGKLSKIPTFFLKSHITYWLIKYYVFNCKPVHSQNRKENRYG